MMGQLQEKTPAHPPPSKKDTKNGGYVLRLYITGNTARSSRSILNVNAFCQRFLSGNYELEVIDIYQQPALAKSEQIIAAPTLIKKLPLPLRTLVGDFSDEARVAMGLGVEAVDI